MSSSGKTHHVLPLDVTGLGGARSEGGGGVREREGEGAVDGRARKSGGCLQAHADEHVPRGQPHAGRLPQRHLMHLCRYLCKEHEGFRWQGGMLNNPM